MRRHCGTVRGHIVGGRVDPDSPRDPATASAPGTESPAKGHLSGVKKSEAQVQFVVRMMTFVLPGFWAAVEPTVKCDQ